MAQTMKGSYWPWTTAKSKRQHAAHIRRSIAQYGNPFDEDPDFWDALATLQEQGRLDEWKSTFMAWQQRCADTKPHPRELLDG